MKIVLSALFSPRRQFSILEFSILAGLAAFLFAGQCVAKPWYVDQAVTAGMKDGTSWSNAWNTLSTIDWTKINPGDILYISGGTYSETLTIPKGGVEGSPITIKVSQEAGHNIHPDPALAQGPAVIIKNENFDKGIRINADWVTIDGAKSDSFATNNIGDNTFKVPLLKNNLNLKVMGDRALQYNGHGPLGVRILWADITPVHQVEESKGIYIASSPPYAVDHSEVAYSWIHDTWDAGIEFPVGNRNATWNSFVIHHSMFERIGNDGFEISGPLTLHHTIVGPASRDQRHNDGLATQRPSHWNIYNNIFYDFPNSLFYPLVLNTSTIDGLYFHGNILYNRTYKAADGLPLGATIIGMEGVHDLATYPSLDWSDIVIANNTFIGGGVGPLNGLLIFTNRYAANGHVIHYRNVRIKNNIIYNDSAAGLTLRGYPGSGIEFSPTDIAVDYNVIWSNRGIGNQICYLVQLVDSQGRPTCYSNAEAFNAAYSSFGYTHNTSKEPLFNGAYAPLFDYSLAEGDTAALNKGADLASYGIQGLSTDLRGIPRGNGGAWDIGALEAYDAKAPQSPLRLRVGP